MAKASLQTGCSVEQRFKAANRRRVADYFELSRGGELSAVLDVNSAETGGDEWAQLQVDLAVLEIHVERRVRNAIDMNDCVATIRLRA